jgi:hypothetical protein
MMLGRKFSIGNYIRMLLDVYVGSEVSSCLIIDVTLAALRHSVIVAGSQAGYRLLECTQKCNKQKKNVNLIIIS